jgi:hypothetical protein
MATRGSDLATLVEWCCRDVKSTRGHARHIRRSIARCDGIVRQLVKCLVSNEPLDVRAACARALLCVVSGEPSDVKELALLVGTEEAVRNLARAMLAHERDPSDLAFTCAHVLSRVSAVDGAPVCRVFVA